MIESRSSGGWHRSFLIRRWKRIASRDSFRFRDRLRELGVMPVIAGALAYIRAGGPFRGAAAVRYAYERAAYESLLALGSCR